jgi:hypothetical protein
MRRRALTIRPGKKGPGALGAGRRRSGMRTGGLLMTLSLVVLIAASTASATRPLHEKSSFSASFDLAAGEFCDFAYHQEGTAYSNALIWLDGDDPRKVIDHQTQYVTHTNVATGFTLTEVDHFTFSFNARTARFRTVGLFWHLRTAAGKVVAVHAGQWVIDANTGETVKITPNFRADIAAVICPALGGHSAL